MYDGRMFLRLCVAVVLVLFAVSLYRAYVVFKPCDHKLVPLNESNRLKLSAEQTRRFQDSLRIPTVSTAFGVENRTAKLEHLRFLRKEFAEIETHGFVSLEIVNELSMLYKIAGSDRTLKPYLLAAHLDVVPADGAEDNWSFDPFGAEIHDGHIYARGTMDDKQNVISILEAATLYLRKHGQPRRTLYLAFGHDEEISGYEGASKMADLLKGTEFEYVLDEGTVVIDNVLSGVTQPMAAIGVADKGYLTVKYFVNVTGGHSSMPNAANSALFIIANALNRIREKPFPSLLGTGPEKDMFEKLAGYMGFFERLFLSNIWLFKPVLKAIFASSPTLDSFQRTTTAPTILRGGLKDNVVPAYAEAVINYRIHSTQTCSEVIDYHVRAINDERVKAVVIECVEPSPISPADSLGYTLLEHVTRQVYPEAIIVPGVMIGLTDSRFYNGLTKSVYKYNPIRVDNADLPRVHGVDERVSLVNYENLINFYYLLIGNTDRAHLEPDANRHSEF